MAEDPLHLLCIEPRFPGRLGAVADWLVRKRGYRCDFYCRSADPPERWPETAGRGLEVVQFTVGGIAKESIVPWTRTLERGLCYAYGCQEALAARNPRGVDLVLGRSAGLGSTLFVPAVLGRVPIVNFFDYFQHAHAHDLAAEAGAETPPEYFQWRRAANAMDLLDLESAAAAWTPTRWQRDVFPAEYREEFTVLHDGIDMRNCGRRNEGRSIAGRAIPDGMKVVTFVARSLDRIRGFDRFMELANRVVRARADVLCVVIGESKVHRGLDTQFFDRDYRAHVLAGTPPHDPGRFWFLGSVPHAVVAEALGASDLHIHPSRPYVAARSLLEAMAAGAVVLAWDTEPVREFVRHGETGLLAPADHPDAQERLALAALEEPAAHRPIGEAAAALVRKCYGRDVTLPALARWFDQLVAE